MCDVHVHHNSEALQPLRPALGVDDWESILVHLPAPKTFALRVVSKTVREAAGSPPLWVAYTEQLINSLEEVDVPEQAAQNPVQYYFSVVRAQRQADADALATTVLSYKYDKDYMALKMHGQVHGAGTESAAFVPLSPIKLPVKAVVAAEVIRLYSTVPASKEPKGDKYRKASHALQGNPNLHQALRNLEKDLASKKRDSALGRPLARPFPDPTRAACGASPRAAAAPVGEYLPDRTVPVMRRAYYAERKDKAKEQLFVRMNNLVAEQASELESLREQLKEHAAAASRERGARLSLQRRFDTEKALASRATEAHSTRRRTLDDKLTRMRETLTATRLERNGLLKGYHEQVDSAAKAKLEKEVQRRKEAEEKAKKSSKKRQAADKARVSGAAASSRETAKVQRRADSQVRSAREVMEAEVSAARVQAEREVSAAQAQAEAAAAAAASIQEQANADQLALLGKIMELEAEVEETRASEFATFKKAYVEQTLVEMKRGKLSPNKTWIAAAVLATGGNGEIHLPQHNASRRGPGLSYLRVSHARTGSKDATEKTRRKRATM